MSTTQFTAEGVAQPYATTQYQEVPKVSIYPEQIVGLVNCEPQTDECYKKCFHNYTLSNDYNSFLFQFATDDNSGGLVDDYRLEKKYNSTWTEVVTGNTDNTLGSESGEKFTFGTFADYPFYSGYIIDWNKVWTLYGGGTYRFKVYNLFDQESPSLSTPFDLREYNCKNADKTVYFEMTTNTNARNWKFTKENNAQRIFKLVNSSWTDSNRYISKFRAIEIEREEKYILYGDESNQQGRVIDIQPYEWMIFKMSKESQKRLFHYGLEGKNIKITDENKFREFNYNKIDVISSTENSWEAQEDGNALMLNTKFQLRDKQDLGSSNC
jgi:hypothetical protein